MGRRESEFLAEKNPVWRKNTFAHDCVIMCQCQLLMPNDSVSQAMKAGAQHGGNRQRERAGALLPGYGLGQGQSTSIIYGHVDGTLN